jgi:translation initiation factor 2 subunit 1
MFYRKTGRPEIGEVLLCTVKKILPHSVFVYIDEYENIEGMIHISEIAPGRIRTLRDYVKEGKRIVCQVLNIKGKNIDLSLRRVGTNTMVDKLNQHKQEIKSEALMEMVGKEFKLKIEEMYKKVGYAAIKDYGSLYNFFQNIVSDGESVVKPVCDDAKIAKALVTLVKDKIKPVEYTLSGILKLTSYEEDGVETIKKLLSNIEKKGVKVTYLGAPNYSLEITSIDKKTAGNTLTEAVEEATEAIEKIKGVAEYKRNV